MLVQNWCHVHLIKLLKFTAFLRSSVISKIFLVYFTFYFVMRLRRASQVVMFGSEASFSKLRLKNTKRKFIETAEGHHYCPCFS